MNIHKFLDVVPKFVKTAALVIPGVAMLIGLAFGRDINGRISAFASGLVVGALIAIWLLGLGYVYADARRRAMPPILWTLIAAFIPNLLGFLLYFALRRPIPVPCPHCGQPMTAEQRFCSWCGYQGSSALSGQTP
jgi:zinc-ribbon domain